MDELRLALRRLTKRPASTLASIATLACAIGAGAVTWSTLSAVLLKPLPIRDADRVVIVSTLATTGAAAGTLHRGVMYPYYPHIRNTGVFDQVAAAWLPPVALLVEPPGETPEPSQIAFVTHDFFDLLGVGVPTGRGFSADDDRRGATPVGVLSDRYWRGRLNADPGIVGRTLLINTHAVAVVGIAAPGFRGLNLAETPDVYLPFHVITSVGSPRTNYLAELNHASSPSSSVTIVARLGAGTSPALATARLSTLPPAADERLRGTLAVSPINAEALPLPARAGVKQFASLLAATVGLLLLIGCTTVGLLLLLRTEARREEFAMCLALGASSIRLARGIALEGLLLAACGALLSLPVAVWLFALIQSFQLPGGVAIERLELTLDGRVLGAVAAGAIVAVLLISLIAGAFGFRANVADALRARAGATARGSRRALRAALVGGQVAVALCLLAGAGLFVRSLTGALSLNGGLDPERLIPVSIALAPHGYNPERAAAFFNDLQTRLTANPAIQSVSATVDRSSMSGPMPIDGVPRQFPTDVRFWSVDQSYFATLRVAVLEGRNFSAEDSARAPLVGIVSESFARLLGNGASPLGRRITMPYSFPPAPPPQVEVVGVVPDVIASVSVMEPLVLYMPVAQQYPIASRSFLVRAADSADAARREILGTIRQLDASVTPAAMHTMQERLGRQMSAQRFGATVLGALGVIAVLLTLLGTYVLADSMATTRMREMGIRAALGATRRQLGSIVLAETGRLVGIGIIAGLGLAWLGANTIRAFLFQVQPLDPLTLATVAGLILALSLVISLRAAVRAARVDLAQVLRNV